MSSLSFPLLMILLTIVSSTPICYDRCDKRWEPSLYTKEGICEDMEKLEMVPFDNEDRVAEHLTIFADVMTTFGLPCFGVTPCTPLEMKKLTNIFDTLQISQELGIEMEFRTSDMYTVRDEIANGALALLIPEITEHGVYFGMTGNFEGFQACDARGEQKTLAIDEVRMAFVFRKQQQESEDEKEQQKEANIEFGYEDRHDEEHEERQEEEQVQRAKDEFQHVQIELSTFYLFPEKFRCITSLFHNTSLPYA
eukprot:TRINITY_DN10931_c0_g1_i16.p1 TRINITY_DN10931_c0_g1~~TRINITY_DN10931_c0_g1_i16.p1  ORF type:complete len:252 (+),score=24.54 TRINITY_DN10931_c0_g1_i16:30-785(+)